MTDTFWNNISVPSVIAKDECLYCFESIYNETATPGKHSLNLCLSCFQTTCHRHLPIHAKASGKNCDAIHSIYLNISKVRKAKEDGDRESDKSNKKIKLNVIEKSEDEMFDTIWSLFKYNLSTSSAEMMLTSQDSNIPMLTSQKIKQILDSKSQEIVDQTSSWELTVKSCPHTRNFEVPKIEPKSLNEKCSDCHLNQNLWLCLHCGNVGCGREQVGIEGYSHALNHFENNRAHSLAVKLGSLSQSSIDLYCYSCNDEVKFENQDQFTDVLSKFDVDLDSKKASEKSLVELQVEQNMNWDFQMTDAQGNDLKRLTAGKEYSCGLINLGNSCYMNSILQCLLNGGVKDYSLHELGNSFPLDVLYPSSNLKCQLIKLNNAMKLEPELYPNGLKPKMFKKCIAQSHEEFSSGRQQDALEFLTFLTDSLDKRIFWNTTSNPNNLMKFEIEDRLQCNKCGKVRYTTEPSEVIQLPLKENDDAQDLLERLRAYFQGEELEFKCAHCKEKVTANIRPGFKSFPDTLVINPIRLKLQNWTPVKTSNCLTVPGLGCSSDTLDLSNYKSFGFDTDKETLLPEGDQDESDAFVPNPSCVSQLTEMGFGPDAIARALYTTGNLETETAMNWLFEHMEDPGLNEPFAAPSRNSAKPVTPQVDPEAIDNMTAMGLDPKLCRKALVLNKGDVNRSVEWVFNNIDDDGILPEENTTETETGVSLGHPTSAPYKLFGVVCHKGNSAHSGHYVAFIRKTIEQEEKWVLYNDEKIVLSVAENFDEIKKNGYLYFYSRV